MHSRHHSKIFNVGMAERLNNIAYAQHNSGNHNSNFNPRSVSLDIRTPEELAAVNEFLVTLGRDVAVGGNRSQQQQQQGGPSHSGTPSFSPETYFDAMNLSQLGLAGMPGMPNSGANFASDNSYNGSSQQFNAHSYPSSRSSHPSVQPGQYGTMYPPMGDSMNYPSSNEYCPPQPNRRQSSGKYAPPPNPSYANQHYNHPTPPLESSSPHSTVSTPVTSTPPQIPLSMPEAAGFDYLRTSRGAPPVAHLSPVEFMGKSMRPIVPLKSAPGSAARPIDVGATRPEPVEPKLTSSVHRGLPAKLTTSSGFTPSMKPGSLYPLLTSGDVQYKLPPLSRMYRSPSPPSRESSPSSAHSSPQNQSTILPSLRSIASPGLRVRTPAESDELAREIGRIELENRTREIPLEERRQHAELIRNLLVTINMDFKQRYGVPTTRKGAMESSRDVEMTAA